MPSPSEPPFDFPEHLFKGVFISDKKVTEFPKVDTFDVRTPMLRVFTAGPHQLFTFADMYAQMVYAVNQEKPFNRGKWQQLDISGSPMHATRELRNVTVLYVVPSDVQGLRDDVHPDMPWADAHFDERVGGEPLNPAPSYKIWPHHNGSAERHVEDQVFSHTYPERFWPKYANPSELMHFASGRPSTVNCGIRYAYGDLDDVVEQLVDNPDTRQAVLPVWFPEDTGDNGHRVPCSLFYHFMSDGDGTLSVWYSMRSCDLARHFRNDVYLAGRLLQWVCERVNEGLMEYDEDTRLTPGCLNMTISNLHVMEGDLASLKS